MITKEDLDVFALRIQDSIDGLKQSVDKILQAHHCINGVLLYDNADLMHILRVSSSQLYKWCI